MRFNNPNDKQSEIRIINGNNEGNRLLIIILITLLESETIWNMLKNENSVIKATNSKVK